MYGRKRLLIRTAGTMSQSKPEIVSPLAHGNGGAKPLPPAWREFIRFCGDLRYGEIERLCIQDGLPVLAEITTKKVKFTGEP